MAKLTYGVLGELELLMENNYGDISYCDETDVSMLLTTALNDIQTTDPKQKKEIKELMNNPFKQDEIIEDFMKSHKLGKYGYKKKFTSTPQEKRMVVAKYSSGERLTKRESAILGHIHSKAFGKRRR